MNEFTEEQFELLKEYLNTVNVIDEGFSYVISSFNDFKKTEGDRVLSDIIQAFSSVAQTNTLLEQILRDDSSLQQVIKSFSNITDAIFKLDGFFDDYHMKMKVVNEILYPAFSEWKDIVNKTIEKYVVI